jgi:DNA-binding transcriptional regulator YiaG
MDEKNIIEAVKALRDAMNVNQVTFSVRLGKSLSMIQRYGRKLNSRHSVRGISVWRG